MGFFSSIFGGKKGTSVLGVDIGSSSLKVVQLRSDNGVAVLETYGELALGPYAGAEVGQATSLPADKIAETLRDLLREANVTTKDCGVSIPFARSLLILVELPRRENPAEQKTVIELEARKYIPVPVSEVQLDWFILPESDPSKANTEHVKVLLVAVHNDELKLLESVAKGAELSASFYEIEIFSTIRSVVDEPVKPVLVLDIGASATKAYIVERGIVAFSHNISNGGQDVTQAIASAYDLSVPKAEEMKKAYGFTPSEEVHYNKESIELVFSRILSEARRVLVQYETAHSKSVSGIVLTGGGGVTKDLGAYAATFFSMPVRVADPFAKTQAPEFMRPILSAIGPEFAVAVGVALRKLEELG
jgi:type IV pilus assembly protein PilM